MKKAISVLLCLVTVFIVITGCSNSQSSIPSVNSPSNHGYNETRSISQVINSQSSILDYDDPSILSSSIRNWFSNVFPNITLELINPSIKLGSIPLPFAQTDYWIVWSATNVKEPEDYYEVAVTKSSEGIINLPKCNLIPGEHDIIAELYNPSDFFLANPIADSSIKINTNGCLVNTPSPTITPSPTPTPTPSPTATPTPNLVKVIKDYLSDVYGYNYQDGIVVGYIGIGCTRSAFNCFKIENSNRYVSLYEYVGLTPTTISDYCLLKDEFALIGFSQIVGIPDYCNKVYNNNPTSEQQENCGNLEENFWYSKLTNHNIVETNPDVINLINSVNIIELAKTKIPHNPELNQSFEVIRIPNAHASICFKHQVKEIQCKSSWCDLHNGSQGLILNDDGEIRYID